MNSETNPEKLVLSCILNDESIHDIVIPDLRYEYFKQDRELLGKVLDLYKKKKGIDTYVLAREFPEKTSDILSISSLVASSAHVGTYVAMLKDNYIRGELVKNFAVEISFDVDPFEYLAKKITELIAIQESLTPNVHRTLVDIINDSLDRIYNLKNNPESTFGIATPLSELNQLTNGWQNQDLIILAGRPSRGKTAFALANVRSACEQGKSVAFFSLEMSDRQLMDRLIWSFDLPPEEAGNRISTWKLDIFERGGIDIKYVMGNCRLLKRNKGLDLVVIDYLGLMKLPEAENRAYQIGELTKLLKAFAKEIDIPIMLLCQLNREIEKRGNHKHYLSDLRESGDIEQNADLVVFISRPCMDGVQIDKDGESTEFLTVVHVAKHRNGKADVIIKAKNNEKVNFYSDWQTF